MRIIFLSIFVISSLFALDTSDKLFECTEIFKARKSELLVELERIDEQRQALSALKAATEELLKKREAKLSLEEEAVQKKYAEIAEKEENVKIMLKRNEVILAEIKSIKMDKTAQTFAKMKAGAAANILSDMELKHAAKILRSLKPKTVGKILSKMDAKKASELTVILAN
jgi:flagellar motility protein MotE (MotC chaperone)